MTRILSRVARCDDIRRTRVFTAPETSAEIIRGGIYCAHGRKRLLSSYLIPPMRVSVTPHSCFFQMVFHIPGSQKHGLVLPARVSKESLKPQ